MRLPPLKDLLNRFNLSGLTKGLLSGPTVQVGTKLNLPNETAADDGLSRTSRSPSEQAKRPKTATPPVASVLSGLTEARRQAAGTGNIYRTIRNVIGSGPVCEAATVRHGAESASGIAHRLRSLSADGSPTINQRRPTLVAPTTAPPESTLGDGFFSALIPSFLKPKRPHQKPDRPAGTISAGAAAPPANSTGDSLFESLIPSFLKPKRPRHKTDRPAGTISAGSAVPPASSTGDSLFESLIPSFLKPISVRDQQPQSPLRQLGRPTTATPAASTVVSDASAKVNSESTRKRSGLVGKAYQFGDKFDPDEKMRSKLKTAADVGQAAADVAGIFDPTGVVDGVNAAFSLARAVAEPERRWEHLGNAAISAISMVPFVGDVVKLAKAPKAFKAAKAMKAGKTAKTGRSGARAVKAEAKTGATATSAANQSKRSLVSDVLGKAEQWGPVAREAAGKVLDAAQRSDDSIGGQSPERQGRRSFISQVLSGAQKWAPMALQMAENVFADADKREAQAAGAVGRGDGKSSFFQNVVKNVGSPIMGGLAAMFGKSEGSESGAPNRSKRRRSEQPKPGFHEWPARAVEASSSTQPTRRGEAEGSPPGPGKSWWRVLAGGAAGGGGGGGRGRGTAASAGDPDENRDRREPDGSGRSSPRRRSFGEVVGGMKMPTQMFSAARSRAAGGHSGKAHQATNEEALNRSFGDIMGGKRSMDDVKKEIDGERAVVESKHKLATELKDLTGKFGKFALAVTGVTKAIEGAGAIAIKQQGHLEDVNPTMALASQRSEVAKFFRDLESGRQIAPSNQRLQESHIRLQNALQPTNDLVTRFGNNIIALLENGIASAIETANATADTADKALVVTSNTYRDIKTISQLISLWFQKNPGTDTPPWVKAFDEISSGKLEKPPTRKV